MTILRRIRSITLTLAAILGVISVALVALGIFTGIKPTIVISGSMEPALPVGSLALTKMAPASEAEPGDIVTVPRQDGDGLVTHRVVKTESAEDGITLLTLRGDANKADDPAAYPVREIGEHVMTVPYFGHIALFVRTPIGLIVTLGVLIGSFFILSPPKSSVPKSSVPKAGEAVTRRGRREQRRGRQRAMGSAADSRADHRAKHVARS